MTRNFDIYNNRLSYSKMLQPEPEFELAYAVGTTYSIDLEALLGVPISLGLLSDIDNESMADPLLILKAIQKSSDKISIFCNPGNINCTGQISAVYSLLENSIFEIQKEDKRSRTYNNFHPKVWVIKYNHKKERKSYIRILVLSRNLTFDNSIDICVKLDGEVGIQVNEKNKPLADFVQSLLLTQKCKNKQQIELLIEDLLRVKKFNVNEPFDDYEFIPIGIDGYSINGKGLFANEEKKPINDSIVVMSPFLSRGDDGVLQSLTNVRNENNRVLLTRQSSLSQEVFDYFKQVYVVKETMIDNEENIKSDIHAKIYFVENGSDRFLFLGSANASYNAFNKNTEFLLKLHYIKRRINFDTFCSDIIGDEDKTPYQEIFKSMCKINGETSNEDDSLALKKGIYAIKNAQVIKTEDALYNVKLSTKKTAIPNNVFIAPLQNLDKEEKLISETLICGLNLHELSLFYQIRVNDKKSIIKIETKGIPEERDNAIYNRVISTKKDYFRYISILLNDDYSSYLADRSDFDRNSNMEYSASIAFNNLYEKLITKVYEDPKAIKSLIEFNEKINPDLIDKDFSALLKTFENIIRKS